MLTDRELMLINDNDPTQPLSPFIRHSEGSPSYGLSSCGYDIRLSNEFYRCKSTGEGSRPIIDPLALDFKEQVANFFTKITAQSIIIEPLELILAASFERFNIPDNISMELKDKSTLARLGLQVFNTFSEPEWPGILTIEIFNNSPHRIMLHSGMAIGQAVFHQLSGRPNITYADKVGKYMNQGTSDSKVTLAR